MSCRQSRNNRPALAPPLPEQQAEPPPLLLRCKDDVGVPLPLDAEGGVEAYAHLATLFGEYEELNLSGPLPVVDLVSDVAALFVAWLVAAAAACRLLAARGGGGGGGGG